MPAMALGLGVPVSTIEFSLATLFLGAAIGQLIWGPCPTGSGAAR
jgi:hypothetical protein